MYKIVNIPEKMEKFYGKGTMLHPEFEQVKELVQKIPGGKIATIDLLAQEMARQAETDVSCPMRTGMPSKRWPT